ncbi:mandelate racemase/muconate lactonizing enzyme family protein [Candidatus Latescibacterota bacterium]
MKDTIMKSASGRKGISRRSMLRTAGIGAGALSIGSALPDPAQDVIAAEARSHASLKITDYELINVRAPSGAKWIFVRLKTNLGLTGLGEASFARNYQADEIKEFFPFIRDTSPFNVETFRQRGMERAEAGGLPTAAAFCSLEMAMWDLIGKALGVPVYNLFGGKVRDEVAVYANINRATSASRDRSPKGFAANAREAVRLGDTAIKAAPFDGFPKLTAPIEDIRKATETGIACIAAIREAVGPDVKILIDCHSNFNVEMAVDIARRLEPYNLFWYEEPVDPKNIEETKAIKTAIKQTVAGGEMLFGMEGFATLCTNEAVEIIMPDLAFCGGIKECMKIATMAELFDDILVSPHNPVGPVSTAATMQVCAAIPNFNIMERQWNPNTWRGDLVDPPERFINGAITVPDGPGIGVELNESVVKKHLE